MRKDVAWLGVVVLFILCLFGTLLTMSYLNHIEAMAPYICMDS